MSSFMDILGGCITFTMMTVVGVTLVKCFVDGLKEVQQERRLKNGLCVGCGYDLRESPYICPECGLNKNGAHNAETD